MTDLAFTYDETELGWRTDPIVPTSKLFVEITLKTRGRVAFKQGSSLDGEYPKVYISPIAGPEFQFVIEGDLSEDRYLQIITSEEPESIKYEGTVKDISSWYLNVDEESVWISNTADGYFNIDSNTVWKIN